MFVRGWLGRVCECHTTQEHRFMTYSGIPGLSCTYLTPFFCIDNSPVSDMLPHHETSISFHLLPLVISPYPIVPLSYPVLSFSYPGFPALCILLYLACFDNSPCSNLLIPFVSNIIRTTGFYLTLAGL